LGSLPTRSEPKMPSRSRRAHHRPTLIQQSTETGLDGGDPASAVTWQEVGAATTPSSRPSATRSLLSRASPARTAQAHLSQARPELAATAGAPPPWGGRASADVTTPCSPPSFVASGSQATTGHTSPPPLGEKRRRHAMAAPPSPPRLCLAGPLVAARGRKRGDRSRPADFAPYVA
jgi:hypothetical protein